MSRIYPSTDFERMERLGDDRFPELRDTECYAKSNLGYRKRFFVFVADANLSKWRQKWHNRCEP